MTRKTSNFISKTVKNINIASKIIFSYKKDKLNNYNHKGDSITFKDGYMVSLYGGYIIDITDAEFDNKVFNAILTLLDFNLALKNVGYIGFWESNGKLYIDLSINIPAITTAESFALSQKQLAFYDCKKNIVYDVEVK